MKCPKTRRFPEKLIFDGHLGHLEADYFPSVKVWCRPPPNNGEPMLQLHVIIFHANYSASAGKIGCNSTVDYIGLTHLLYKSSSEHEDRKIGNPNCF